MGSDTDRSAAPSPRQSSPANRLGLDYRSVPGRKLAGHIIDVHTHVRAVEFGERFFEAATAYGIGRVFSMSPLEQVEPLKAAYGDRLRFIAAPRWQEFAVTGAFRDQWCADLTAFRQSGAQLCKFWSAPYLRQELGLTLDHDFMGPVIQAALDLDYEFMVHVADPSAWWQPGGKYSASTATGSKPEQYDQLEWFLDHVAPRKVIAAHMGGYIEDLAFLQALLDRHSNLWLDTSATKWMVREIARQPDAVRTFVIDNHDRILFGSDLVADQEYDFGHYASRYWAHLKLWESSYRGESPIVDPDADDPPRLAGLDLPPGVLAKLYHENAGALL